MKGMVTIGNVFHNTKARVLYPGGVHPIPEDTLRSLCPWKGCRCIGTPYGAPVAMAGQDVKVEYDSDLGRWVITPAKS